MSADLIIKALLEQSVVVTNLVGEQIWGEARPEGKPLPALVTTLVSDIPVPPFRGSDIEPWDGRVQIESHASTLTGAKAAIGSAVGACHLRSGAVGGFHVNSCLVENVRSGGYDQGTGVFSQLADVLVKYQR